MSVVELHLGTNDMHVLYLFGDAHSNTRDVYTDLTVVTVCMHRSDPCPVQCSNFWDLTSKGCLLPRVDFSTSVTVLLSGSLTLVRLLSVILVGASFVDVVACD